MTEQTPTPQPTALERRYRTLLRAYPAAYRADRGPEIVGTYLDGAAAARHWPSLADAANLIGGGLRQRLRSAGALALLDGLRIAATLALALAAGFAALFMLWELRAPQWTVHPFRPFGPFATAGVICWAAWMVAGTGAAVLSGRSARWLVALALAATVLILPLPSVSDHLRPPLLMLVPQIALGLVALAVPVRRGPLARLAIATPMLVAAGWAAVGWLGGGALPGVGYLPAYYRELASGFLPGAGLWLLVALVLAGLAYQTARDGRVLWAALILMLPLGLTAVYPIAAGTVRNPDWADLARVAVALTALSVAALGVAVAVAGLRRRRSPAPAGACPTCGRHG